MIKNFIWDFDGTLFDSYPHITEAMCTMLDNNKIEYDKQEVMKALQVSFSCAFNKYGVNAGQKEKFLALERDMSFKPPVVPYPEAERILMKIKQLGFKNFIYTHREREALLHCLDKYKITDLFVEIVSKHDGFEEKPSPDAVKYIVSKYKLNPQETAMIGDREIDVKAGTNAGCVGCFITNGNAQTNVQAEYIVSDLKELEKKLLGE